MEIGRKIYFEKATGNVLVNTGERAGSVIETTIEQDYVLYEALNGKSPSAVGVIQLSYGELHEEFMTAISYKVNLISGKIDFTYGPNNPDGPTPTPEQLRITELEAENANLKNRVSDMELFVSDIISGGGL